MQGDQVGPITVLNEIKELLQKAEQEREDVKTRKAPLAIELLFETRIGQDRNMTLRTFIPQETAPKEISDLADKLYQVVDRQQARYTLKALERDLWAQQVTLQQMEEGRAEQEAKRAERYTMASGQRRKEPAMTPQEEANKAQWENQFKRQKITISRIETEIAEAKALIGQETAAV